MMTVQALARSPRNRHSRGAMFAVAGITAFLIGACAFIAYVLWPTWPRSSAAPDAPAIPVTVAEVLFNVPPAAIRNAMQRNPGAQERLDLVFQWPSLAPAAVEAAATPPPDPGNASAQPGADERLFVTVAALGTVLDPVARLRTIYPRYAETQAAADPDGLAVLPFRAGTPYEGEDLIYVADTPERFFVRCTRPAGIVPGTCLYEKAIDAAEVTVRFPRQWLATWGDVASGIDRLIDRLHPAAR